MTQLNDSSPLVEVRNLQKHFTVAKGTLHAVDGVSLSINKGTTLGLVGESGCGKSTFGRVLIGLISATGGEILFKGENTLKYNAAERERFRTQAQIVFQDPFSSLNPRMTVYRLIAEPLIINKHHSGKEDLKKKVLALMDVVGLSHRLVNSYPHELDGGRRQRIGIARALALEPEFIVLDEPVSALDVSIQAQVINLLNELQRAHGYTYLFISHDLSVVRYISDMVAVMYLGSVVEQADNLTLFSKPLHPYSQALLSAVPSVNLDRPAKRIILEGDIPSPVNPPDHCRFAQRCPYAQPLCLQEKPLLREVEPGHLASCHYVGNLQAKSIA